MRPACQGYPGDNARLSAEPRTPITPVRRQARHPWQVFFAVCFAAALGIAAGRTVIAYSGSVSVVDGESMSPTYVSGARVYTVPLATTPLERGDIVLVDDGKKEYALKRVIGLPGETVQLWRGYVFVNTRMLREPYLPKHTYTFPDENKETWTFHLDNEEFFLLGDNRRVSVDSRSYGPVAQKQIKSRVPPEYITRPGFAGFRLPASGKRTIRPL